MERPKCCYRRHDRSRDDERGRVHLHSDWCCTLRECIKHGHCQHQRTSERWHGWRNHRVRDRCGIQPVRATGGQSASRRRMDHRRQCARQHVHAWHRCWRRLLLHGCRHVTVSSGRRYGDRRSECHARCRDQWRPHALFIEPCHGADHRSQRNTQRRRHVDSSRRRSIERHLHARCERDWSLHLHGERHRTLPISFGNG